MSAIITGLLVYGIWILGLFVLGRIITRFLKSNDDLNVVGLIFFWALLLGPQLILDNGNYWSRLGIVGLFPFLLVEDVGKNFLMLLQSF